MDNPIICSKLPDYPIGFLSHSVACDEKRKKKKFTRVVNFAIESEEFFFVSVLTRKN